MSFPAPPKPSYNTMIRCKCIFVDAMLCYSSYCDADVVGRAAVHQQLPFTSINNNTPLSHAISVILFLLVACIACSVTLFGLV